MTARGVSDVKTPRWFLVMVGKVEKLRCHLSKKSRDMVRGGGGFCGREGISLGL